MEGRDRQEAHPWRSQARRRWLSGQQAAHVRPSSTNIGSLESGKCKGALVGIVLPYNISLDGDRHPNAEGIIEHDGVAALQRIIDKYGVDISGAIRGTTPGERYARDARREADIPTISGSREPA